ncbi:hypothetical protein PDJAM_G00114420 [Pangasius djambal]|uniref:Uncharacterized protein n=2 Tax=Pangasius djambal TaxID=1691987 RepID=A0ACC5Y346_9TELE|nr:hypothetical protein [Pangasius djambal]
MWVARQFLTSAVLTAHYRLLCRRLNPRPEFSPRFLQCTYCWRARIPAADLNLNVLHPAPAEPQCRHDGDVADATLDSLYTPDQRDTILQLLNTGSESELAADASSIVSIVCGTNRIAWTHMDRAMTVLEWQQEDCHSFMKGTYMASSYLDDICGVVSNLPAADFYVVEKPSVSVQNTALFPVVVHLRTVEAMLFALLSARRDAGAPPNVLNMMRVAVGRHFGLIVGESRTSGAEVVRKMMAESAMKKIPRVIFPNEMLVRYSGAFHFSSRNKGQEMCDALLQAVAFYELLAASH